MSSLVQDVQHKLISLGFPKVEEKFMLALSGGLDSVVLLDLLSKVGLIGILAHVNYGLRKEDSDKDEALARHLAEMYGWEIEVLDAKNRMLHHPNESLQMAARRIRYDWFSELEKEHHLKAIFLAHHADDQIETFFIKLFRGSGSEALSGMSEQNGIYFRPLLDFTKETLLEYAQANKLTWREDLSNQSDKYLRNAIRLNLLPELKNVQANYLQMVLESVGRLKSEQSQLSAFTHAWIETHVNQTEHGFKVLKTDLLNEANPQFLIHELLKKYGFSWRICTCIAQNLTNTHTQHFQTRGYSVQLNRIHLSVNKEVTKVLDEENVRQPEIILEYFDEMPVDIGFATKNEAWVLVDKIQGELCLRKWQKGYFFWPSGMIGRKLLSDYFTDLKLLPQEREEQWILTCDNEIVWIVNRRIDRRFAAFQDSKNVIRLTIA
jgi:tRNA(Ile)-lysidine synthase